MKLGELLLGAAIGAVLTYTAMKVSEGDSASADEEVRNDQVIPFSTFQQEVVTLDILDGRALSRWAAPLVRGDRELCVVALPTEAVLRRFNIQGCPDELDPATNAIQFVVGLDDSDVHEARLISFGVLSEKVKVLFGEDGYFILQKREKEEE